MTLSIFQQTVAAQSFAFGSVSDVQAGCLLQIYPLELDAGPKSIDSFPFTIGRDESCELSVPDSSISRNHCQIQKSEKGFLLSDLGSTNGTFIGDREIHEQLLAAGDQIRLGNRIYKFMTSDNFEAQYHETVYSMMTRDSLTGVWNKRYFLDVLTRDLHRGIRHGHSVALILFDIDFFKKVNDTHGHLAGDDVLAEMGQRLGDQLRCDEVLARYGGEEFALVLSDFQLDEAVATAERCREAVRSSPFQTSAGPLDITISLGVAVAQGTDEMSPTDLIQRADDFLYLAKENGRDCVAS